MVFNVTITIGAITFAQPLRSIIFRCFSDKKIRYRCFLMVVNNRSSDAIIRMHRSSLYPPFLYQDYHHHHFDIFLTHLQVWLSCPIVGELQKQRRLIKKLPLIESSTTFNPSVLLVISLFSLNIYIDIFEFMNWGTLFLLL